MDYSFRFASGGTVPPPPPMFPPPSSTEHFALPHHIDALPALALGNGLDYAWRVHTQGQFDTLSVHVAFAELEVQSDYVQVGAPADPITGSLVDKWWDPRPFDPWNGYIQLRVVTDSSMPSIGYAIDAARVTCRQGSPQPTALALASGERAIGLHGGANDTVYYAFRPDETGKLHGHLAVRVPPLQQPSTLNVYVRCGAFPTASSYDYATTGPGNQKFIDVDEGYCPNDYAYVAVDSESHAGMFEIGFSHGGDMDPLCVLFTGDGATAAVLTASADRFLTGMRGFFGATHGAIVPRRVRFRATPGTCWFDDLGISVQPKIFIETGTSCSSAGQLNLVTWYQPPFSRGWPAEMHLCATMGPFSVPDPGWMVPTHELSHFYFGVPDEYDACTSTGDMCGMSHLGTGQIVRRVYRYCSDLDHRGNPQTGAVPYADPQSCIPSRGALPEGAAVSMWTKILSNHYERPLPASQVTQDNVSYADFDALPISWQWQ